MARLEGVKTAPFAYVAHALAALSAVLVIVWSVYFRGGVAFESTNKALIFNLHPILMLIGLIIIGGEAAISYKILPWSREVNKQIHLILHAVATALGALGIYFAFKYHNESGIANLYSLHSWVGLGTIILYGTQWIFAFITFFYPGAAPTFRRSALPWHALAGLFIYILAVGTAELGFLEKLTFLESSGLDKYGSEAFFVNITALVVILLGASFAVVAAAPAQVEPPKGYAPILTES